MRRQYVFDGVKEDIQFDENFNQDAFVLDYKLALLLSLAEKRLLTKEQYAQCVLLLEQNKKKIQDKTKGV